MESLKNQSTTLFLRAAILAIGATVLALCIFALPAMWLAIPDEYPSITYALYCIVLALYVSAIPFFFALYQALLLLKYIDKNQAFSDSSLIALKRIKYSAIAISIIYAASMPFFFVFGDQDDAPGVIVIGTILTAAPLVVAVFAAVLQRLLSQIVVIKSENDLTV